MREAYLVLHNPDALESMFVAMDGIRVAAGYDEAVTVPETRTVSSSN